LVIFGKTPKHIPTTSTTKLHRVSTVYCRVLSCVGYFQTTPKHIPATSTTHSTVVQPCITVYYRVLAWFCDF
jgi:hypothetical protein